MRRYALNVRRYKRLDLQCRPVGPVVRIPAGANLPDAIRAVIRDV